MPYAKETRREKEKARAAKRRASGLCQNCNSLARPGRVRCEACAGRYGKQKGGRKQ